MGIFFEQFRCYNCNIFLLDAYKVQIRRLPHRGKGKIGGVKMEAKDKVRLTQEEAEKVSGGLSDRRTLDAQQLEQQEYIKKGMADRIYAKAKYKA